jgi:iron(III) transport system permease protein
MATQPINSARPHSIDASLWAAFRIAVGLVFGVLILVPLLYVLGYGLGGTEGSDGVVDPDNGFRTLELLATTLSVALGSTLLAAVLGIAAGVALVEVPRIVFRLLAYGMAASFLIPGYVGAITVIEVAGAQGIATGLLEDTLGFSNFVPSLYSRWGVILVLGLTHYPLVAAATVIGLRRVDRSAEEAGAMVSSDAGVLRRVSLPLAAPTIATGTLLCFLLGLVEFAVPSLLQVRVFSTEIHSKFAAFHDVAGGLFLSTPMLVLGVASLGLWRVYVGRRSGWKMGGFRMERRAPGSRTYGTLAGVYCVGLVLVSAVIPLGILFWRSLPLRSYVEVWRTAGGEFGMSLAIAAATATAITTLGFAMAYTSTQGIRTRGRWTRALYSVTWGPFLISGPALGIALIAAWNHVGLRGVVYDSMAITVLACAARFLLIGYWGSRTALATLNVRAMEAAEVCGVGRGRRLFGVAVPLSAPYLLAIWGLSFLMTFGEVDASQLVTPPGATTLPVRIFGLMHYGPDRLVAALSVGTAATVVAGAIGLEFVVRLAARRVDAFR